MPVQPYLKPAATRPRAVILLSGGGSNAERLLAAVAAAGDDASYQVAALVTDNPGGSRARELADQFKVPLIANDIREFYRAGGESRVTLATPLGRDLRERWTAALRQQLAPLKPDFGILAGFVPLTNLTGDFPCLNVHPGDLTYLRDGQRWLVGLHTVPIERAILEGLTELRSSVILALPYTGGGGDMDNGPLLGLSGPVSLDRQGHSLAALQAVAAARPTPRPVGGYHDALATLAKLNQERLKVDGDWVVFPRTVDAFARGRYGADEHGNLHYRVGANWLPIETVEFTAAATELRFAPP